MDTSKKKNEKISNTLRRPVTVVKKRSGPLEDMLDQLDRDEEIECKSDLVPHKSSNVMVSSVKKEECTMLKPVNRLSSASSSSSVRRRSHIKDKEKKRERWLLTRKTWRYMTDAGRKLLPDGIQHSDGENLELIEAHFQQVCTMEPRFILWRRKSSYPGATKHSRKRLKILLRHRNKQSQIKDQEDNKNIDQTIEILQSYLKIRDAFKTTALLSTKTVRPDQTASPSSRRPINQSFDQTSISAKDIGTDSANIILSLLRQLNRSSIYLGIDMETGITPEILEDKTQLKKIYNTLKKQQLHRLLDSTFTSKTSYLGRASSMSNLRNNRDLHESIPKVSMKPKININATTVSACNVSHSQSTNKSSSDYQRKPLETLQLNRNIGTNYRLSTNSCGTQTNFIQLNELKLLAEQYEQFLEQTSEEDTREEKQQPGLGRKSSIDNEDISQSVSDTIKRYLRMARKKSVHDADANRFKSVNYDRNLRNIKAKGEINPPGMDDDNSKAVQTLDAWAVIALDYIRGIEDSQNLRHAHIAWQKDLDERVRKKMEYDKNLKAGNGCKNSITEQQFCNSAPTSPTTAVQSQHHHFREKTGRTASALFSSSSQFLSNFWHANSAESSSSQNLLKNGNSNLNYLNSKNERTNMQKSKSLSNVGQFVSRKIWGNRSKYQNRQDGSPDVRMSLQKWAPSENCTWISDQGQCIQLSETSLEKLSDIEAESLIKIALEKIRELNIGTNIDLESKVHKRRVLLRKRALTTSFFDIGKKDEQSGYDFLFGISLENCLLRDKKRQGTTVGSKHSLMSLFLSSDTSDSKEVGKLHNNVRSCESLPTKPLDSERGYYYFKNIGKSQPISQSQLDVSSGSEMDFEQIVLKESTSASNRKLNVPMFVLNCIEYLEEHGLEKIGLFRVSTSKRRVKQLREELDKNLNMCIPVDTCPHDVATLLKEYLRDLPEPLLCTGLYATFLETQRIRNRRLQLEAISHLVKLLPTAHRDTLYVLLKFLGNVAARCDDVYSKDGTIQMVGNKMDSNNLSTVFAPNILRESSSKTVEYKERNLSDAINVIRIMIDHYEDIFKVPGEVLDLLYTCMLDTCPEKLHALISEKNSLFYNSRIEKTQQKADSENQIELLEPSFDGRRQSTPVVLENPQVISASLQITMPEESSFQKEPKRSEPKLPASISNTGETALFAKTAEFEKPSHRQVIQNGPIASTPTPTIRAKTLYKRQQLISSSRQ